MKRIVILIAAAAFALSLPTTSEARVKNRDTLDVGRQASCKWRAKQKYPSLHPLKRRAFLRDCLNDPYSQN